MIALLLRFCTAFSQAFVVIHEVTVLGTYSRRTLGTCTHDTKRVGREKIETKEVANSAIYKFFAQSRNLSVAKYSDATLLWSSAMNFWVMGLTVQVSHGVGGGGRGGSMRTKSPPSLPNHHPLRPLFLAIPRFTEQCLGTRQCREHLM